MRGAALACLLALACAAPVTAQDSVVAPHTLPLELARLHPWSRTYDMVVHTNDSSVVLGTRTVSVTPSTYGGGDAWLIAETRTGTVPSAESLYVSPDFRPLHWSSVSGATRLATEFVGDSLFGAATAGTLKENIVLRGRRDVLVNGAMTETALSLLPLMDAWADSAAAVSVGLSAAELAPVEIEVLASELVPRDSSVVPAWVVAIRSPATSVLYWMDKATGIPLLIQQALPAHTGRQLEFRLRSSSASGASP